MDIGIIGAGNIGGTLATLFAQAGHTVVLSNSRGPETIAGLAGGPGGRIRVGTVAESAAGEVVVEAIPFGHYHRLPAEALRGKVVISAANYYPDRDGTIDLGGRVDTELLADFLPGVHVVKAFNTIRTAHLQQRGDVAKSPEDRRAIPIAGDDTDAKALVAGLVADIGFVAVDTGSLHEGGLQQNTSSTLYDKDVTGAEARQLLAG